MYDRFTRRSRLGRGGIPKRLRREIYKRDSYTCQYCGTKVEDGSATIDHVVPLALGGLDETINYVTCCQACNERKGSMGLVEFARTLRVSPCDLPVHGDPVIDNSELPAELRALRKQLILRYRHGELRLSGTGAQKKLEKQYRREFWDTPAGQSLQEGFPALPGPVRIMIPEIKTGREAVRKRRSEATDR